MIGLRERYELRCQKRTDIHEHLPTLHDEVIRRDAQTVIEIGVGSGNSTIAFLAALEETGGTLWSFEIDPSPIPDDLQADHWHLIVGDSLANVDQAPADAEILFIDSEHTYEQTLFELVAFIGHVRPGGVVFLHDTGPHQPGVRKAIDAFCEELDWTWTDNPRCYGLGRIDVP